MNKQQTYEALLPQLEALLAGEREEMSVLANVTAVLKEAFGWFWTGFYVVREDELRLGPFQGPLACMHIGYGRGVCGTSWKEQRTLVVPDVELFPGHIACSSLSRSEIVVPVFSGGAKPEVMAVIDIDHTETNTFDATDQRYLEQVAQLITRTLYTENKTSATANTPT